MRRDARWFLVAAFLVIQPAAVYLVAGKECPPAPPDFAAFPSQIGSWIRVEGGALDAESVAASGADRLLSQNYVQQGTGETANLFIAWYQSQRNGTRQPHSPQVCLPGSGWLRLSAGVVQLPSSLGAVTVNRSLIAKSGARAVVLYWYQTPRRVVANEWAAKMWVVMDAVRDKRTDTSLVRVFTPVTRDDEAKALAAASALARNIVTVQVGR